MKRIDTVSGGNRCKRGDTVFGDVSSVTLVRLLGMERFLTLPDVSYIAQYRTRARNSPLQSSEALGVHIGSQELLPSLCPPSVLRLILCAIARETHIRF